MGSEGEHPGLAKLPLDDDLLRSCGTRPGRQLQHSRALALAQARNQDHLSVRKLQCIMMGHGVVRVDLSEARELLSDFLVRENANAEPRLALYILVERNLGARRRQTATCGSPTAAKPRVMELLNLVVTSLSSIWAGRVATLCKL